MIYILWGLSGPLKRIFVEAIDEQLPGKSINKKASTRPKKEYDGKEMTHYDSESDIPLSNYPDEYRYEQYGYTYAINKSQIEKCVKSGKDHFIICHNFDVISNIKKDFKDVKVVFLLFFDIEGSLRYVNEKYKYVDDIEKRINKFYQLMRECGKKNSNFDKVIPLYHFDNEGELEESLWESIREYLLESSPNAVGFKDTMNGFIIMPFNEDHDTVGAKMAFQAVENSVKPTRYSELHIGRVDDLYDNNGKAITENIYKAINDADFIIADLTDNRPNCYYELGYARALGKDIVVVAKEGTKLEFDESDKTNFSYSTAGRDWRQNLTFEIVESLVALKKGELKPI